MFAFVRADCSEQGKGRRYQRAASQRRLRQLPRPGSVPTVGPMYTTLGLTTDVTVRWYSIHPYHQETLEAV